MFEHLVRLFVLSARLPPLGKFSRIVFYEFGSPAPLLRKLVSKAAHKMIGFAFIKGIGGCGSIEVSYSVTPGIRPVQRPLPQRATYLSDVQS